MKNGISTGTLASRRQTFAILLMTTMASLPCVHLPFEVENYPNRR
jgi:hypothetical protein